MDFSARYVLINPPPTEAYQARLSTSGLDDTSIQNILSNLPEELDESKTSELFDKIIHNEDDVDEAAKSLSGYIFSKEDQVNGEEGDEDVNKEDTVAEDSQDQQGDEAGSTIVVATSGGTDADADAGDEDESMEDASAEKLEETDDSEE